MPNAAVRYAEPTLPAPEPKDAPKRGFVRPRRVAGLGPVSANTIWIPARVAEGILQITKGHVHNLAKAGELRREAKGFNLADVLERYRRMLRVENAIDEQVEATCVREFEANLIPQEVVMKHSFGIDVVANAWEKWNALRKDPDVARIMALRAAQAAEVEASRCKECLRTPEAAAEDTARIVREVTREPLRRVFSMTEERALAALNVRCVCGSLKVTVNTDTMRARLRAVALLGPIVPPPPSVTAALTDEERVRALCNCAAGGDIEGQHDHACPAKQYTKIVVPVDP